MWFVGIQDIPAADATCTPTGIENLPMVQQVAAGASHQIVKRYRMFVFHGTNQSGYRAAIANVLPDHLVSRFLTARQMAPAIDSQTGQLTNVHPLAAGI